MKYNFLPSLKNMRNDLFDNWFNDIPDIYQNSLMRNIDKDFVPKMDVSETDNEYCLEIDLPGMTQKDVNVKVDGGLITISGKKSEDKETKKKNYYTRERGYGEFFRSMSLPSNAEESKIDAKFKDGVLEIIIPKKTTSKAREIMVQSM